MFFFQKIYSVLLLEIGTFNFFSFRWYIVRERPIFFQSFKKIIMFVHKIIVNFPNIFLDFSLNDRSVKLFVQ